MKRLMKIGIVLWIMISTFLILFGIRNSEAQQYLKFTGKVTNIYRGGITVEGDKGEVMNFAVGRRTIYIPNRLPGVGEYVKVSYLFQRGRNVGYQIEIVPPPAPPKKK